MTLIINKHSASTVWCFNSQRHHWWLEVDHHWCQRDGWLQWCLCYWSNRYRSCWLLYSPAKVESL